MPGTEALSWAVLDDDGSMVEPVDTYLAYLAALERSPNTQRASRSRATDVEVRTDLPGAQRMATS